MKLAELIKQERFTSPSQEAMLSIIVTSNWVLGELAATMSPYQITPAQYNVLRILRGCQAPEMTCSAIGERLLDRTPDVTRLLNRLEQNGLVRRERASHDRRVVEVSITPKGRTLLDMMQPDIDAIQARLTRHLSAAQQQQLIELLDLVRLDQSA